jgi:hypothetical protein
MEDVPVPTVIKPTAAAQAARDAAFRMIPEELRDGLGQITDVLPVMLRDAPLRSRRRDLRRGRDVGNDEAYEEAAEDLKRRMMALRTGGWRLIPPQTDPARERTARGFFVREEVRAVRCSAVRDDSQERRRLAGMVQLLLTEPQL